MEINEIVGKWQEDPDIAGNISCWVRKAAVSPKTLPLPLEIEGRLVQNLDLQGIQALYSHQAQAYQLLKEGRHIVIATGTASGKTLCYNLPVANTLIKKPGSSALYLFPTKALAQDQVKHLHQLLGQDNAIENPKVAIYDGDTPSNQRAEIRKKAEILITNPDMLHQGILPHHTTWKRFLSGLAYVVVDEMHTYRGVFGSHVANLLRRLKRICAFYGAYPQFVLTSATIGNPQELGEKLIEMPISLVNEDGSPHGEKHFLIYNPPLINEELGIRKSVTQSSIALAKTLLMAGRQSLIFARTRRTVEMILTYLQERMSLAERPRIRGYRSGYLKAERRQIEDGFKDGKIRLVVATSALELGIDIGGLESVLINGYPGSIARTLQQAGRAGRKQQPALAVLLAAPDAMDQYLAHHPEYITERNPEAVLIDPNNLSILLQHLRCACFELPMKVGDSFGSLESGLLQALLEVLVSNGMLIRQGVRFFWVADQYPAGSVSLRSSSTAVITLKCTEEDGQKTIGEIDSSSATWLVHPEAIYLHEGEPYYVEKLDLEKGICQLSHRESAYYTIPSMETSIEQFHARLTENYNHWSKHFGDLQLLMQLGGYRKYRWMSNELIGNGIISLPPQRLETSGFWMGLQDGMVDKLRGEGLWLSDPNDYGSIWPGLRQKILARDGFSCRGCGARPEPAQLHVHHIQPYKSFLDPVLANAPSNLVTLCHSCHQQAEISVRVRSGLAGVGYALRHLAPLLVMCDGEDIATLTESKSILNDGKPAILIYDNVPGGIGLSARLFENHSLLLKGALEMVSECPCQEGCPACVGPMGEEGFGGKSHAIALLRNLL
ncbi:MAG: DEAD/DEAH box helicase [Anaerolineaceae bacterium]|nr:DEAD/DEAH box helicase [Anaerolineaceae bacterium]